MKVLVCGSRDWTNRDAIREALATLAAGHVAERFVLIHGACPTGADPLAAEVASDLGWDVVAFPADWKRLGLHAGPIRNRQMLAEGKPDRVIAFRSSGESRGTDGMVALARQAGLPLTVVGQAR